VLSGINRLNSQAVARLACHCPSGSGVLLGLVRLTMPPDSVIQIVPRVAFSSARVPDVRKRFASM